ncbi:MAG: response regulator transcription factor [Novosphingobium sp.]
MGISVSIINPSSISREGLRRIILDGGIEVVATSASVEGLPELPDRSDHLVLVDMPSLSEQLDSLQQLASREMASALILAEKFDMSSMLNCFDHGAQGYAVKDMPCDTLIALLRLAALGHKVIPPDVADMLRRDDVRIVAPDVRDDPGGLQHAGHGNGSKLSQRENDVLCCLMAGYSNKRIARKLLVTEATVKVHVKAILRKLNVANRTQAAMWATTHGVPSFDMTAAPGVAGN